MATKRDEEELTDEQLAERNRRIGDESEDEFKASFERREVE